MVSYFLSFVKCVRCRSPLIKFWNTIERVERSSDLCAWKCNNQLIWPFSKTFQSDYSLWTPIEHTHTHTSEPWLTKHLKCVCSKTYVADKIPTTIFVRTTKPNIQNRTTNTLTWTIVMWIISSLYRNKIVVDKHVGIETKLLTFHLHYASISHLYLPFFIHFKCTTT